MELTRISAGLKNAFKRLSIVGVVAAQIRRINGNRPTLQDLRESGSLEEHADSVTFLHRDDYVHRGDPSWVPDRRVDLIVAKNRGGPVGSVKLHWIPETQSYQEPDPGDDSNLDLM
jgi:replicative DNA helicase